MAAEMAANSSDGIELVTLAKDTYKMKNKAILSQVSQGLSFTPNIWLILLGRLLLEQY